jgi:hypothetical protein
MQPHDGKGEMPYSKETARPKVGQSQLVLDAFEANLLRNYRGMTPQAQEMLGALAREYGTMFPRVRAPKLRLVADSKRSK